MDLLEKNPSNHYTHPWEMARAASILKLVKKNPDDLQYVDVGSGDMFFSTQFCNYKNQGIIAVDSAYSNPQSSEKIVQVNDISKLQENSLDCCFLMDVLEHIEDENAFLGVLTKRLKSDGMLIITVPAYQFLFSSHDRFLKHYRRYSRKSLEELLQAMDLSIIHSFYFYSILFLIRLLQKVFSFRLKNREEQGVGGWRYSRKHLFTQLIAGLLILDFNMHYFLEKIGLRIAGLSICIVCRKKSA